MIGFALQVLASHAHADLGPTLVVVGAAVLIGALGAADDLVDFGARPKLLLGAVLAVLVAASTAPVATLPLTPGLHLPLVRAVAVAGGALWFVTVANAVNFIDGADGLAPGAMIVAFAVLALAAARVGDAPVAAAALAVATAVVGFLPWNLRGRLFLGDAGALFLGFLFAGLHLAAATRRDGPPVALYLGPLALLPILGDVLLTLAWRAASREPLLEAHRQHLYQRWLAASGRPHAVLATAGVLLMLLAGGAALIAQARPALQGSLLFGGAIAATLAWFWLGARLRRIRPRD